MSEHAKAVTRFLAFCVERFKLRHGLDGLTVGVSFAANGIFKFLSDNFEVEHGLDAEQIVDDIDIIMRRKGALA